jgi:two-component system sensor histidine kinase UhpB
MSLFWRVFAANAAILTAGALVPASAPGPLHKYGAVIDLGGLLLGLVVMLVVNGVLLRRLFQPLERLVGRMEAADALRGGQRVPVVDSGEIGALERAFNRMLQRLESERRDAAAYALKAQEEERQRLARGLHDEVGQSMTAVLLQLKRMTAGASPEQLARLAEAQQVVKASLEDVRRLAQATEVLVSLERGTGSVVLRVVDNGHGFGRGHAEGGGLRGIRERALIVGGAAAIGPGPGGGVEVRLEAPAQAA